MSSDGASDKSKSDCYSAGERGWMEFGQRARAKLFDPLLRLLSNMGVSPDLITFLAGIVGLGFIPCWLLEENLLAACCVWTHVLLDGVDGPLARYQGIASNRGSFTDTFVDQVVVTGVTVAWMIHDPAPWNIAAGSAYVFTYAIVVAMAMVRNALSVPYSWLVRPRFFVYGAVCLDGFTHSNWTLWVLLVCVLLLGIKCLTGFLALRNSLPGPESRETS
ncbi:MAG: CDP-alcohol phosphatidyltransferase family protein [Planctomycetales bacterium]|nr:CDP-alcohol phosphatidyltransferase family protein [Planctomycetales bacterium]